MFDIFTGRPARVNDVEQVGLEMEQADDLVALLNRLYAMRRSGLVHWASGQPLLDFRHPVGLAPQDNGVLHSLEQNTGTR